LLPNLPLTQTSTLGKATAAVATLKEFGALLEFLRRFVIEENVQKLHAQSE
jgi:hypothetical protein